MLDVLYDSHDGIVTSFHWPANNRMHIDVAGYFKPIASKHFVMV